MDDAQALDLAADTWMEAYGCNRTMAGPGWLKLLKRWPAPYCGACKGRVADRARAYCLKVPHLTQIDGVFSLLACVACLGDVATMRQFQRSRVRKIMHALGGAGAAARVRHCRRILHLRMVRADGAPYGVAPASVAPPPAVAIEPETMTQPPPTAAEQDQFAEAMSYYKAKKRRGRPPGGKNRPKPFPSAAPPAAEAQPWSAALRAEGERAMLKNWGLA